MHVNIPYVVCLGSTPLAGALAWLKGDKPERYGALILILPIVLETILVPVAKDYGYAPERFLPYIDLMTSFAISAGFLYLAVRYASQWLAAAMVVQGAELYFARSYIDADPPNLHIYALEVNTITITVCSILIGAAITSWLGRIKKRRDEASRQQRIARREQELQARYFPNIQAMDSPVASTG